MNEYLFPSASNSLFITCLFYVFLASVATSLFYHLFFFHRLASTIQKGDFAEVPMPIEAPGVSVVICAWNELDNLKKLIPVLLNQDYPIFEIIIVDDRSDDECYDFLLYESFKHSNLKHIRINDTPDHIASKKYALTLGIKAAIYDVILLTDADCMPESKSWIRLMASRVQDPTQIILGFSPYRFRKGFLNFLIRHETFYTAVQYMSFAIAGIPYMGVGRNLVYRKSLFIDHKGFRSHLRVVGGDDDLFVGEVATAKNTAINLVPESFVYSEPKHTFKAWFRQKRRHLAVGKKYRFRNKFLLGLYSLGQLLFWLTGMILLANQAFVISVAVGFVLKITVQLLVFTRIAKHLDTSIRWHSLLLFDFLYMIYYSFIGTWALFTKRISWN